jgi:hypothetical protein
MKSKIICFKITGKCVELPIFQRKPDKVYEIFLGLSLKMSTQIIGCKGRKKGFTKNSTSNNISK